MYFVREKSRFANKKRKFRFLLQHSRRRLHVFIVYRRYVPTLTQTDEAQTDPLRGCLSLATPDPLLAVGSEDEVRTWKVSEAVSQALPSGGAALQTGRHSPSAPLSPCSRWGWNAHCPEAPLYPDPLYTAVCPMDDQPGVRWGYLAAQWWRQAAFTALL